MEVKEVRKCSFACPGTFGHECGAPAVTVAVFANQSVNARTKDGLFFTGRCAKCLGIRGGENKGLLRTEAEAGQANQWVW